MKTKKEVYSLMVKVLGVTIKAKFKQRINISDKYFSEISLEQAKLCYVRAVKLLCVGKWLSDIRIMISSDPFGESSVIRLFYFGIGEGVCSLEVVINGSKARLEMSSVDFSKVVKKGLTDDVEGLTEQKQFLKFDFDELDKKLFEES
jgi:hypothetical protein